jgi:hypothetical protein
VLDPRRSAGFPRRATASPISGAAYLVRKKAQQDARTEAARRAPVVTARLFDKLAALASATSRSAPGETGAGGQVLLDAAFLVPRSKEKKFRAAVTGQARRLAPDGYGLLLSGPWPPYSFSNDRLKSEF